MAGIGVSNNSKLEKCVICLENREPATEFFSVQDCDHRYCISCVKQQAEVKLLNGLLPKCLHESCNLELEIASCRSFLTPELLEIMTQVKKEASIPVTQKIYCPYSRCSFLMSKTEVAGNSRIAFDGSSVCTKCGGQFCINCKVPWHSDMSCDEYAGSNSAALVEKEMVKNLAERNLWRQCVKCSHMIELAAGCFHVTCRCGYEFCYKCGTEYKEKKATCSCPLWDEQHIIYA